MNNIEKQGLKILKGTGLTYELKYLDSPYSAGYIVKIPELFGRSYYLRQPDIILSAFERYKSEKKTTKK